jgi:hypothetical protein
MNTETITRPTPPAAPKWPKPTHPRPTWEEMEEESEDCYATATDGCTVEPDGVCEHGHPSWLLRLHLI